jgi:hypothetical protein
MLYLTIGFFAIFTVLSNESQSSWGKYDFNKPSGCLNSYALHLEKGIEAMLAKEFTEAIFSFSAALEVPCFEIPNYELYGVLAVTQCKSGDINTGMTTLRDFECMLSVDTGEVPCFVPRSGPKQHRNEQISGRCFEVMCSEIFLGYYESPTKKHLAGVEKLRAMLPVSKMACQPHD